MNGSLQISSLLRIVADLIFPRLCLGCGERLLDTSLPCCETCEESLSKVGTNVCRVCGCPDPVVRDNGCRQCPVGGVHFDSARGVFHFQGVARETVERLKYRGHLEHVPMMARAMLEMVESLKEDAVSAVLVPVPLYPARRRERGFNQSEELCGQLGEWLSLPVCNSAVRRVRPTPSQTRLTRRERRINMKQAFELASGAEEIQGRTVILVDDVYTTGSTLNAVSEVLRAAEPAQIHAVAYARALLLK